MDTYFKHFHIPDIHLPHITPLMGGIQQCDKGYSYGPVMRRYYIIEYVLDGCGEYIVNGHSYTAKKGDAFMIRPYETHLLRADNETPWEYVWIGFSTDLELPRAFADNYVIDAKAAEDIFTALAKNYSKYTVSDFAVAVYGIFARLYALQAAVSSDSTDPIDTAISVIRKEYASITVNELSQRLFMNRSYFGARFKKKTGVSPKQYIDEVRLSSAAMMMTELGYTATQAALACGYSDAMSFSRMYKKHFGKPPRSSIANRSARGGTIILK